ncbi:RNase J family beta-CASP ribonuclease [Candidatus Pacearchaeota archaeon]|nr:RNase J family beta-CASP ribonuclease [Candidatus Pacearchaeota archaeon]
MRIHAIGGYDEVGKNMTAVEVGNDVFLFDAGLHLPAIVGISEKERVPTERGMRNLGALPDDVYLETINLRDKVRALMVSHAHLDHVGGVPYVAPRYKAPVIGSPYTMSVLKVLMQDSEQTIPNKIITVPVDGSYTVKTNNTYQLEFINMTHSTIQSSIIALHTPEGIILYANDYKLDNAPVFGEKPNYARLKQLAQKGVKALIVDCLYAPDDRKTPSEKIARGLLEDVLCTTDNSKAGIIITTFSSHIARLKSIVELSQRLNRKVVFFGRSLSKYVQAASNIGKAPFKGSIQLVTYKKQMIKMLKKINKAKSEYVIVCTGHQGEPGSILDRIARQELPFDLSSDVHIIFSSKTIPTDVNEMNRDQLEKRLRKHQVRIFDNVHVSGHGGREDLRDLITLVKPEHVIPSHGELQKRQAGANLAEELGYKVNKTVHLMDNGSVLTI